MNMDIDTHCRYLGSTLRKIYTMKLKGQCHISANLGPVSFHVVSPICTLSSFFEFDLDFAVIFS